MGAQVGVLSLSQLQLHDHYNVNSGGPINIISRVAGGPVKMLSAAIRMTAAGVGVFAMLKRIIVLEDSPGTMDVNYTLTRAGGAGTIHGQARIYRAGVLIWSGVDNAEVAGPTNYTDAAVAVDLLAGDLIEVWGYVSAGAAAICAIEALEINYNGFFTSLTRRELAAGIALTAASDVLYTAVL